MELLYLKSSNSKFRTINFNSGLNIIVGAQLTDEQKKSINGIGKSMSLNLIHYMLGAGLKPNIEKYLATYGSFELSFSHQEKEWIIKKNFSNSKFYVNDEEVAKKNYLKRLNKIFLGNENTKPSFRQLLNCFARRYDGSMSYYNSIFSQQSISLEDYNQKYANLSLLGIEMSMVEERCRVKEELNQLEKVQKVIAEYQKSVNNDSDINDIKDEIASLNRQVENFIIAENYDQLKQNADELTSNLNGIRNKIFLIKDRLTIKKNSLSSANNIKIDLKQIEAIFNEAKFFFENKINTRLEDAQVFHNSLINNRKQRLSNEIIHLKTELEELNKQSKKISQKRDNILKDLNNVGALEERDSLKDRIKSLETEQKNLEKYKDMLSDFRDNKSKLDVKNAIIKQNSITYLKKKNQDIVNIENEFRALVKSFYDNKGGSFAIEETVNAKYLFDIKVHIPRDGSQGVGEVKIFCYDILLYLLNKDLFGFLAHDGCIFSEMDDRQKSTIFKIILKFTQNNNLQYFLNVGDNTLKGILDNNILTQPEKDLIQQNIILKLADKPQERWLFGENFN